MIEKLKVAEVQNFISLHEHDDPAMLMLQSKKRDDLPLKEIVQQIQSRQKAARKIPEWYHQAGIIFPPPLSVEQSSSEVTAKYKAALLSGTSLVDITGGGGVDTYYCGKSFAEVHYVEREALLCELADHNFKALGLPVRVHHASAEEFLFSITEEFDVIYIDPARRDANNKKLFLLKDCEPDIRNLLPELLKKGKKVLIKASPMLDIHQVEDQLEPVKEIHIIAVANEVKEVLYLLERGWQGSTKIATVNLNKDTGVTEDSFTLTRNEERGALVSYSHPQKYLYEPNKAVLKAGAFKSIASRFDLVKLHPNSHLYSSEKLINFPGRVFECLELVPYQKKALLKSLPDKKANITTRNFPDTVQAIRKRTGIKEGGNTFIFATTNIDDKLMMIICKTAH